jgi:hypothetical protein
MKSNVPQKLVIYTHAAQKLYYISCYNFTDPVKFANSSSIRQNYNRAKFLYQRVIQQDGSFAGLQSGFMMAIINSNFDGWEMEILDEVHHNAEIASYEKESLIDHWFQNKSDWTFVGSHYSHVKGIRGNGKTAPNWNRKWNIGAMKQANIREKIDFICQSIPQIVPQSIYTDAYMAVVSPDRYGPRMKNFGGYEITCLATLFRFVRQYMNLDQEVIHLG